jgi:hypothetical protein
MIETFPYALVRLVASEAGHCARARSDHER